MEWSVRAPASAQQLAGGQWVPKTGGAGSRESLVVARAKKKEYGSGRAMLPLAEEAAQGPAGGAGGASQRGSMADYMAFGRLLGERPQQVQQQLALNGAEVVMDSAARTYMRQWQDEQQEAYALFEAMADAELGASAQSPALLRNRNRLAPSAGSAAQVARMRSEEENSGVRMSSAQRKLARNRQHVGGLIMLSAESVLGAAGEEEMAAFEQVSRPVRLPKLVAKPSRGGSAAGPSPSSSDEEEEWGSEDEIDAAWQAWEEEEEELQPKPSYEAFAAFLDGVGTSSSSSSSSASALGKPERQTFSTRRAPARQTAKLASKPVASAAAVAAAAPPLPPPPPTLAARPARTTATQPVAAPAAAPAATTPRKKVPSQAPPPKRPAVAPEVPLPPPAAPRAPARPADSPAAVFTPPAPPKVQPAAAAAAAEAPVAATRQVPVVAAARTPVAAPRSAPAQAASRAPVAAVAPAPVRPVTAAAPAPVEPVAAAAPAPVTALSAAAPAPAAPAAAAPPALAVPPQQQQPAPPKEQPSPPPTVPTAAAAVVAAAPAAPGAQPARPAKAAPARKPVGRSRPAAAGGGGGPAGGALERRFRNAEVAQRCLEEGRQLAVRVWQVNAAGVLVEGEQEQVFGFVPLSQLAGPNRREVLREEARLAQEQPPAPAALEGSSPTDVAAVAAEVRNALRRQAMSVLQGRSLTARVDSVDAAGLRVVMVETGAEQPAARAAAAAAAADDGASVQAAAGLVGQEVDATVLSVKPFGAFVTFSVPAPAASGAAAGPQEQPAQLAVVGLVHVSELAWEQPQSPGDVVQVGQRVRAVVAHVDLPKRRVFLSLRRATPNPLLATLDSLMGGASTGAVSEGGDGSAPAPIVDLRPQLGDLLEALAFCQVAGAAPGVLAARLGKRLQSRAAAQELQAFLAREAVEAGEEGGACTFKVVLRKGQEVQEVEVDAQLSREQLRSLVADTLAAMGSV